MSEPSGAFTNFIQELRNRRVFRVTAVYLGAGFALLEAADIVVATYDLPSMVVRTFMILLLIGFPLAIGLAWSFQFTPEGLRRSPRSGEKQTSNEKPFTGNPVIVLLLVVIIGLLVYPRFSSGDVSNRATTALDPKAVAVLPFTNFSADEDDAFFADGIHDDILTQLSKIRDLRVISRTTMSKYKETKLAMGAIAEELGAANILEGSVRRAGDQVRIVAQLIKADSDEHLWAETYDRAYADIFSVQTDVARSIANALQSTLSPEEEEQLAEVPTDNMEAYDYYLRGNQYWYTKTTKEGNLKAAAMYERAVELDPDFGLAYARLSVVHSVLYQSPDWDPTEERKQQARRTLQKAIGLIPDHAETHFAKGAYHEWCEKDMDAAVAEFEIAFKLRPNHAETANSLGQIYAERGAWSEGRRYFRAAYELEPDGLGNTTWWAGMNLIDWNFEKAEELYREAIQYFPENEQLYRWLADTRAYGSGDTESALKILEDGQLNGEKPQRIYSDLFWILIDHRDYKRALEVAEGNQSPMYRLTMEALSHYLLGDAENSELKADSALQRIEARLKEAPEQSSLHSRKGLLLAITGDKANAIDSGAKGLALSEGSVGAVFQPNYALWYAEILTLVGEEDRAVDLLIETLQPPSIVTPWKVQLDPLLDALKDHPRLKPHLPKMAI
ncbi:MAG: tetratricopeptide repeat protein [Candidatus Marinimicrobia bacterium]|nr:tetratricopeptide repeat protein [Candidatus Neomarinimicrobiota bacterium]